MLRSDPPRIQRSGLRGRPAKKVVVVVRRAADYGVGVPLEVWMARQRAAHAGGGPANAIVDKPREARGGE